MASSPIVIAATLASGPIVIGSSGLACWDGRFETFVSRLASASRYHWHVCVPLGVSNDFTR
eukprot:1547204-Pleurochrysis_carterae.AAC.1